MQANDIMRNIFHVARLEERDPVLKEHIAELRSAFVSTLESFTPDEVIRRLKDAGIKRRDSEYSRAKELIFRGQWIDSDCYDRLLGVIINYVEGKEETKWQ